MKYCQLYKGNYLESPVFHSRYTSPFKMGGFFVCLLVAFCEKEKEKNPTNTMVQKPQKLLLPVIEQEALFDPENWPSFWFYLIFSNAYPFCFYSFILICPCFYSFAKHQAFAMTKIFHPSENICMLFLLCFSCLECGQPKAVELRQIFYLIENSQPLVFFHYQDSLALIHL